MAILGARCDIDSGTQRQARHASGLFRGDGLAIADLRRRYVGRPQLWSREYPGAAASKFCTCIVCTGGDVTADDLEIAHSLHGSGRCAA